MTTKFTNAPVFQFAQQRQVSTRVLNPRKASEEATLTPVLTKLNEEDTFELITENKLTPNPSPSPTVIGAVSPSENKLVTVMATVAAIASLGTVFGVGMLYAKKDKAQKGMLTEVGRLIVPLEKKLDQLEQSIQQHPHEEAFSAILLELEAIKTALPSKLDFNKKQKSPIPDSLDGIETKVDELANDVDKLSDKLNYIIGTIELNKRLSYEQSLTIKGKKGGEAGFVPVYMAENHKEAQVVITRLEGIKARISTAEKLAVLVNDKPTITLWTPLLQLIEGLAEEDKKNPVVMMLISKEAEANFVKMAELIPTATGTLTSDDGYRDYFAAFVTQMALLHKLFEQYENPTVSFTLDEKLLLRENGFASAYAPRISQCASHHFSLALETQELVSDFYTFITSLHEGILANSSPPL